MSTEIIQQRLLDYQCQTVLDQENALKEIAQEIALMALSRSGFFKVAAFQGGTCLRILYGLERFSEDLDFALLQPDKNFDWDKYIKSMREEFNAYGYSLEVTNRSKLSKAVRTAFIKSDSQGGLLLLKDNQTNRPKLQIKLEVDTNPPLGAQEELKYLDFPMAFSVNTQNLPSLFAGKSHALLCREYVKGRDWYDFTWYVAKKTSLNFDLLSNALHQQGPWQNKNINIDADWYTKHLRTKIKNINWEDAKKDIKQFLRAKELPTLELWSKDFFLSRVDKLESYL